MKKYLSLTLLLVMGCSTAVSENLLSVSDRYEKIVFDDGISAEESRIIAQKQLIKQNIADIYEISKPQMSGGIDGLSKSQDYWFVFFEEKKPASIPFIFMVVIHKETGKIKFADDYNEGNQWILEAAMLR